VKTGYYMIRQCLLLVLLMLTPLTSRAPPAPLPKDVVAAYRELGTLKVAR
jgi:hypothetical protein